MPLVWLGNSSSPAPAATTTVVNEAFLHVFPAVRRGIIGKSPFEDMKNLIVGASPKIRIRLIDAEAANRVLEACPDAHWRAIFALARYGGLRVPSEICLLRWSDIDWNEGRFLVTNPKTKRYEGRETRWTPLFPELRRELEAWHLEAPKDREFILKPAIKPKSNLRTGLLKILMRAGIKPWPKLYQNLRSSRSTELIDQGFPAHVVAAWLGHTVKVAEKHYCQVTDDHFRRAVEPALEKESPAHGAA